MSGPLPEPGWYADSGNPRLLRWWDGNAWTQHTRDSPTQAQPPASQQQSTAGGPPSRVGSGPLYDVTELVVLELTPGTDRVNYQLVDANGQEIGAVHQVDEQGRAEMGLQPKAESTMLYYRLFDAQRTPLLHIERSYGPAGILKPNFVVSDVRGAPIGEIKAETVGMGKNRLSYKIGGSPAGGFKATSWLSSKYEVVDAWKNQVAEIVKREFGEMPLEHIPSEHESYLLSRPQPVPEPLGSLVLLSPVVLDIAYHDDSV